MLTLHVLLLVDNTGQRVKVIVTDFMKDNVFSEIEDQIRSLDIGVLGWNIYFVHNYM